MRSSKGSCTQGSFKVSLQSSFNLKGLLSSEGFRLKGSYDGSLNGFLKRVPRNKGSYRMRGLEV